MAVGLPATTARGERRWGTLRAALLGSAGVAVIAVAFTQLGRLGLGLAPTVALVLLAVPVAAGGAALVQRAPTPTGRYSLGLAVPALALYGAFFAAPLVLLALFAVATPLGNGAVSYGFSLDNFSAALDGLYVDVLLRTLGVTGLGTVLVVTVGLPVAYWLARHAPARRRGLLLALIVVPFWTSFLIRTYSFLIVLSPSFPLSRLLEDLGLTSGPLDVLNTRAAVQLGLVYNYLPLFVLPAYAALERIDWRLVEAAEDLGATPARAFRQITLPQAAPGLAAAALLVFIPMTGEYVIPLVLGGGRLDLIGNVIGRAFLDQQDFPFGAALALVVMGVLAFALAAYLRVALRAQERPRG